MKINNFLCIKIITTFMSLYKLKLRKYKSNFYVLSIITTCFKIVHVTMKTSPYNTYLMTKIYFRIYPTNNYDILKC